MNSGTKPRRWLAVVLSILAPGLGHAYAGQLLRGVFVAGSLEVLAVAFGILCARSPAIAGSSALLFLAAPALVAIVAIDAARIASQPRSGFPTRKAVLLACAALIVLKAPLWVAGEWVRGTWGARSFRLPSEGMLPTLLVGDHVYVDLGAYRTREPRRGEVVAFELGRDPASPWPHPPDQRPELPRESFIKRLVGVPGDVVELRAGELRINGEAAPRHLTRETLQDDLGRLFEVWTEILDDHEYHILDDPSRTGTDMAPRRVAQDRYLLMGDNRDNSLDSRFWGTIAREDLLGPVTTIYWSWDFNGTWLELLDPATLWLLLRDKTRWERHGRHLDQEVRVAPAREP